MSGKISVKDQKILCLNSGNRCAMPECHKGLVIPKTGNDPASIIGIIAHIKGENPTSARYDPEMTDKERNCYDNLILVCSDCHKMIDDQPNTYPVEKLHKIKEEHEHWIIESTKEEVINISFAELSAVTKYLASGAYIPSDSYRLIPPKDKIRRNSLSSEIEKLITMGMIQVRQVKDFIDKCPDIEFGERLKQGFVVEYERLKNEEGLEGDDLFNGVLDFASGGSNDFKNRAAGLTILVYLFEKCEVFEK